MSSPEFFRIVDFYPLIDMSKCILCMDCVSRCGLGVIRPICDEKAGEARFQVQKSRCRNCRKCVQGCTRGAISIIAEMGGAMLDT